MMEISVNFLKTAGASIVAGFKMNGTSLNEGIIIVAGEGDLNADQTARLVETVNQLAYLSGPHGSLDKTAEFPLANYEEVLAHFVTPIEKTASYKPSPLESIREEMTKEASEVNFVIDPHDAEMAIEKRFYSSRDKLMSMRIEESNICEGLLKSASLISKDPDALNKIAALTGGDSKKYGELCNLVFGHVKEARAAIRPEASLTSIRALQEQLGFAKEAHQTRQGLEEELDKIASFLAEKKGINKEAFLGSILKGVGAIARNAGTVAKGAEKGVATAKTGLKLGGTALMAGPEISQIAARSTPKTDIWNSLHN